MVAPISNNDDKDVLDLVVVGAGPHSLALICRLLEESPADVLSDRSHQRLHYLNKHSNSQSCHSFDVNSCRKHIMVIDGKGVWMENWNQSFQAYNIKYLRSPLFFHPDPSDENGLRAFADTECRSCELFDITQIVDQCKKCKRKAQRSNLTENDRNLFYNPSTSLFSDFCSSLVDRYDIGNLVTQGWVTEIIPDGKIFKIVYKSMNKKSQVNHVCKEGCPAIENNIVNVVYTRRVICALGNSNNPVYPEYITKLDPNSFPSDRIVHAFDLTNNKLPYPSYLKPKNYCSSLLVIGGGLTSAQLVVLGSRHGFKRIVLASRLKLKVKFFDLDIGWVGRNSFKNHYDFWRLDGQGRRKMLAAAKDGGSITPEYYSILTNLEKSGVLEIRQRTTVSNAEWSTSNEKWNIEFANSNDVEQFDMIWLGTGSMMDVRKEACLQPVLEKYPTNVFGGLPELDEYLKWPGLELYMMSGYGALSIGPSAGNLFGGRLAAQKIVPRIWESMLKGKMDLLKSKAEERVDLRSLVTMSGSFVNYWAALDTE